MHPCPGAHLILSRLGFCRPGLMLSRSFLTYRLERRARLSRLASASLPYRPVSARFHFCRSPAQRTGRRGARALCAWAIRGIRNNILLAIYVAY